MQMNPGSSGYYSFVNSKFDLDNFKDYFIIQTYIQNSDWMGIWWGLNNTKLWRPQTEDGRWRYVVYDTDAGFGYFGAWFTDNYIDMAQNSNNPHSDLFRELLTNELFQCEFINRYADLINTIFEPSYFSSMSSQIQGQLSLGMPDHIDRWNPQDAYDSSYWYDWATTISSVQSWQSDISSILWYNYQRANAARENIVDEFGLDGQHGVSLDVYPESSGTINISTITPANYPWSGIYFNACPIQILATPNPGYVFDYWEFSNADVDSSLEQNLSLNITEDISIIAYFSECDGIGYRYHRQENKNQ